MKTASSGHIRINECTCELTESITSCAGFAQVKTRKICLNWEWEVNIKLLNKNLFAINTCCAEKKSVFSSEVHFYITHTVSYFMHTFVEWIVKIRSVNYKSARLFLNKLGQKSFALTPLTHRILVSIIKWFYWVNTSMEWSPAQGN